jgi:hypothetical protein
MISRTKNDRVGLDQLADTLVEDILQASDADVLAEAEAGDEDGAGIARATFNEAVTASGRRRSKPVQRRTPDLPWTRTDVRALDPKAARRWLEDFIARDPKAAGKLTTAAAEDGRLSDEDVYGVLERLQERHAVEQRHDKQ